MTREEILAKAKYIQYPYLDLHFKDFGDVNSEKIMMESKDFYNTWRQNEHHFPPMVHFKKSMPVIAKVLDFYFDEKDFSFKVQNCNGYDLTMPYPKMTYFYDAKSLSDEERSFENMTYDELTSYEKTDGTPYHHLFRFFHDTSIIVNKNIRDERKLLLSGDSHMIPVVPMLTPYFHTIAYLDNRKKMPIFDKIKDIEFTDVLIELFNNSLGFYTDGNLK